MSEQIIIKPQAGPQEAFLSSSADIVFYGGAAGGGKTFALLLEPLRHIANPNFSGIIFRRTSPPIVNPGGLWDEAMNIYPLLGAQEVRSPVKQFRFPSGAKIVLNHLQRVDTVYSYQGTQIPFIGFDELTHFEWKQFNYMLSRNRSATANIRPYIRAGCNPDPDSWVAGFIRWYIDNKTGYAIKARGGTIRYFVNVDDEIRWGDDADILYKKYSVEPKSFTFIPSSVYDNKILLKNDPGYITNLKAQDVVSREQLLNGNWKIRPAGGLYFKAIQAPVVETIPDKIVAVCRAWDLAATEETPANADPDKTAGVLIGRMRNGKYIILDAVSGCLSASQVRALVLKTGEQDRVNYKCNRIHIPQDPGQAGKEQAASYIRFLAGFSVRTDTVSGNKVSRAEPFAAQWQAGNVYLLRGDWNRRFTNELEGFPNGKHDDFVDAAADAFKEVTNVRDISRF